MLLGEVDRKTKILEVYNKLSENSSSPKLKALIQYLKMKLAIAYNT